MTAPKKHPVPAVSTPAATAPETHHDAPAPVADAGIALYKDKAAPTREKQVSEGAANFATITADARAVVASLTPDEPPPPPKEAA